MWHFGTDFTDFSQDCSKFHLGGISQAVKNIFVSHINAWHFDTLGMDFTDFHQDCLKFHQGGLSQVKQNVLLPPIHTWHFDTDFTDFHKKFQRELKLTCGCCLWHDLHGLRIKVIKISQGWSFISNKENIFSGDTYVAFGHGLHGLTEKVSKNDKKKPVVAAFGMDFTDLR